MAPESQENSDRNKDSQAENQNAAEPIQTTDDYFENVNKRMKKKSRFGFSKPNKKESEPKKEIQPKESKAEVPEPPVVVETPKVEEPKPENSQPLTEETTEPQQTIETIEPQPAPTETQAPPVEAPAEIPRAQETVAEQLPATENMPEPTMEPASENVPVPESAPVPTVLPEPEVEVKHETVQQKPKKKGFFSFLKRHKEEPVKPLTAESITPSVPETGTLTPVEAPVASTETPTVNPASEAQAPEVAANKTEAQTVTEPAPAVEEPAIQPIATPPVEPIEEQQLNAQAPFWDGVVNIGKWTKEDKARFPEMAVLSIGEYPIHLLLKSHLTSRPDGLLPLFIDKSSREIRKWSSRPLDAEFVIGLDTEVDTHFWYNILPSVQNDSPFLEKLQRKPIKELRESLIVSSIWDGVGSALLPTLVAQFNELKISSVALALMPSKVQSLESQFNAFAAVGKCSLLGSTSIVLLDRDSIDNYLGVDRKGNMLKGPLILSYLLDLMLARETLVEEFNELSKSFESPLYTLMFGTGASIRVYGSIENILDTLLFKQFLAIDLASTELLYVLARVPASLKEKITRAKIEMAVSNWFKDKATLKSIRVSEPVYIEDNSDRIDIALFVGGFNTKTTFSAIEKKVATMKNRAVKNGLLQEDEWKEIVKKLTD
jgi:hypothetical protein